MLPLFAIPIVQTTASMAPTAGSFFSRPIDIILYDILVWFGWIPIALTIAWGIVQMWQNSRQGKYAGTLKYIVLAIDVPSMTEQSPKALENLFSNLYGAKSSLTWKETWIIGKFQPTFSFEIISTEGYIQFLVRTQTRFRDMIEAGIYAQYPDAEMAEVEDYTQFFPTQFPDETYDMWGGEFSLEKDYIYPIRTYVDFEDRMTGEIKDPLGHTLEQFAKMRPGEHMWMQVLVQPRDNDWSKRGVKRLNELYGKKEKVKKSFIVSAIESFIAWPLGLLDTVMETELASLFGLGEEEVKKEPYTLLPLQETKEADALYSKLTKVGMGVKIRILYVAKKNAYVKVERTGIVKGILNQYANLALNKFSLHIPSVPKDDYFWMKWSYAAKQRNLMTAYKKRSWSIGADHIFLNVEEIASLWHFPTISIKAPLVKKSEARRGEPPVGLPVTFLENTLAGFDKTESDFPFGTSDDVPYPEMTPPKLKTSSELFDSATVPTLAPPTIHKKPVVEEETFVPPNLPM